MAVIASKEALHDATVSIEDANLKFLRSLPSVWHSKRSYLKTKYCKPAHIPKGLLMLFSRKVPNYSQLLLLTQMKIIEIDIRWQVAMITARIRKFMRKTGRSIDLKPKNGITFDKSKIECFNCQKLGHFARECRFAKYQENRANVTYAMMALTGVEQMIGALSLMQSLAFGQDGLDDFGLEQHSDDASSISSFNWPTNTLMYLNVPNVSHVVMLITHEKDLDYAWGDKYSHQRRSFIPSAVLTRDGLISTARPTMTQTVPSKSTANVTYQGTARSRVPQAVLSQSTGRPYHPRMDNIRPRTSSFSPSSRSSTTRTPHRPHRPKKIVKSIWVKKGSTIESQAVLPQTVKKNAMINPKQTWRPKGNYLDSVNRDNGSYTLKQFEYGNPEEDLKDYAIIDSGCSGSMTGDKDKLSDFKEFKGGYVAFGNDSKGGRISGKGTIKTSCLDFEKVSYVEELKFNLLSVSQICDKKHNVLFTDKECLILSPKFKFVDEDLVILRAPRKNDVYSLDLKNIIPSGGITCLVAKATEDEAVLWHRRLGHVNFKNINKLVKGNLMDLFGTCFSGECKQDEVLLVVTDDCSKILVGCFFGRTKDESYDMLHDLIVGLENRLRHKVKTIRCDHVTEFKNQLMNEFCAKKGIKREYSMQGSSGKMVLQKGKNRTLIVADHRTYVSRLPSYLFTFGLSSQYSLLWALYSLSFGVSLMAKSEEAICWILYKQQRIAFEEESGDYLLQREKNMLSSSFILSTAKQPPSKYWQYFFTPTDSDVDIQKRWNHESLKALADESWVEAMQEELLLFKLQGYGSVMWTYKKDKRVIGHYNGFSDTREMNRVKDYEELMQKEFEDEFHDNKQLWLFSSMKQEYVSAAGCCALDASLQGFLKALQLKVLLILNVLLQYKVLLLSIGTATPHDSDEGSREVKRTQEAQTLSQAKQISALIKLKNVQIRPDSEKKGRWLKDREAKGLLRKRKATIAEEHPQKRLNTQTDCVQDTCSKDELKRLKASTGFNDKDRLMLNKRRPTIKTTEVKQVELS
ncbi:putative ribonuclease H-like domain-containing protein [Tanacetum coccineum]